MFYVKAGTPSYLSHSLIELLNQVSPIFKRNFALLQKRSLLHLVILFNNFLLF
jgi:hypothetical protein